MPSARDIAFIGCRLLALYALFGAVQSLAYNIYFVVGGLYWLQGVYSSPARTAKFIEAGLNLVPLVVGIGAFLILWRGARWLSGRIVAGVPAAEGGWSPQTILSVAVIFFGLALLYWTLPHLSTFLYILAVDGYPQAHSLISFIVPASIGFGCVFGSQSIADFIGRLRRW